MAKYEPKLTYAIRGNDGTISQKMTEKKYYEGDLDAVRKMVESDYFIDGDIIDDGDGTKLSIYGEKERDIWTIVRKVADGKYKAILRLYEI